MAYEIKCMRVKRLTLEKEKLTRMLNSKKIMANKLAKTVLKPSEATSKKNPIKRPKFCSYWTPTEKP